MNNKQATPRVISEIVFNKLEEAFNDAAFFMDTLGFERLRGVTIPSGFYAEFSRKENGYPQLGAFYLDVGIVLVAKNLTTTEEAETLHHELCHAQQDIGDGYVPSSSGHSAYEDQRIEREARAVGAMAELAVLVGKEVAVELLDAMRTIGFDSFAAAHAARWAFYSNRDSKFYDSHDLKEIGGSARAMAVLFKTTKVKHISLKMRTYRMRIAIRSFFE
jgi:hypothetical protein